MEGEAGCGPLLLPLTQEVEAMGAETGRGTLPLAAWHLALLMAERGLWSTRGRTTTLPLGQTARAVTAVVSAAAAAAVVVTAAAAAEKGDGSAPRACPAGTTVSAACSATAAATRAPTWAECAGRTWDAGLSGADGICDCVWGRLGRGGSAAAAGNGDQSPPLAPSSCCAGVAFTCTSLNGGCNTSRQSSSWL